MVTGAQRGKMVNLVRRVQLVCLVHLVLSDYQVTRGFKVERDQRDPLGLMGSVD